MRNVPIKEFATKLHFHKMTGEDLRKSGSFNLVDDDGFICMVIIPASAAKKLQINSIAEAGNAAISRK